MTIAIASGKGGTGKTTLSVNLASYISSFYKHNVVLVDLDVEEPNSGLFLKGKKVVQEDKFKKIPVWDHTKCTFCGKCRSLCNFNAIITLPMTVLVFPELCHSCYLCSELCPENALPMMDTKIGTVKHIKINPSLSFIEGVLDIGQESSVPLIKQTKEFTQNYFSNGDLIIYDAPPGTSCPVIETVKNADFVLLITEPTPFGLHDLTLAVETVKKLEKDFAVIINRHGSGNNNVEEYCKRNKIPIIGKIPDMMEIAVKYSKGELLYENIPAVKDELKKIFNALTKLNLA